MGDKIEVILEERTAQGKKLKVLRKGGYVPGVVYGHDTTAQSVMAPSALMTKAYRSAGKHQPVELQLSGKKQLAMIKTADVDPVKHTLRHLAFHVIKQNEKVQTTVPVIIEGSGETPAEKAGLVVLTTIDSVDVEALPNDLPEHMVAPGEKLAEIGDHVTVADLKTQQGVTVLSDAEQIVATVYEPGALQAANEATGGTAQAENLEGDESAEDNGSAAEETEKQAGEKNHDQAAKE